MKKNPKVVVLGGDGYLGYSLCTYLTARNYDVISVDNLSREKWVSEIGSHSAIPIDDRKYDWETINTDIAKDRNLELILRVHKPDVIVHLAEQPSAPYSMIDMKHAVFTHENNVNGTLKLLWAMKEICPETLLIKLGTMGEYGTPNVDIPEGHFDLVYNGREDRLPFPKQPGSFYHLTKVHDSNNIEFACKNWNLKSIDINQGPVYGTRIDEMTDGYRTRYDFDHVFGTVINRFCAQAVIDYPLTVYGKGEQIRGYININDSMKCIELCIKNPPKQGEYKVINQWIEKFTVNELALLIKEEAEKINLKVEIKPIGNPRKEKESHYFNPANKEIYKMGLKPRGLKEIIIPSLKDLLQYKDRIKEKQKFIKPSVVW